MGVAAIIDGRDALLIKMPVLSSASVLQYQICFSYLLGEFPNQENLTTCLHC